MSLILISIPCASLHTRPTLVTTCKNFVSTKLQRKTNADWLRNHCDPQCSVPYLQMQGLFWSYFKYQSVCVIPFSNHDWKQTTSLYHAIYITACEGICSCLSVFGFVTCITSPCTLVAKRVEVVPCYTCCYYYYYYVNAFFSSPCLFCILCVMTTERSFLRERFVLSKGSLPSKEQMGHGIINIIYQLSLH